MQCRTRPKVESGGDGVALVVSVYNLNLLNSKCVLVLLLEYILFMGFVVCISALMPMFAKKACVIIDCSGLYLFSFVVLFSLGKCKRMWRCLRP